MYKKANFYELFPMKKDRGGMVQKFSVAFLFSSERHVMFR